METFQSFDIEENVAHGKEYGRPRQLAGCSGADLSQTQAVHTLFSLPPPPESETFHLKRPYHVSALLFLSSL